MLQQVGFGGGCHWCTEAVFQSLKGVPAVQQGWITSDQPDDYFSEGIIIAFDDNVIPLQVLIAIHLYTHSCTSNHSKRQKYRSAVYTFNKEQAIIAIEMISTLQNEFAEPIITQVIPFSLFKQNNIEYLSYYYNGPAKPFCQNFVQPKLQLLLDQFASYADKWKITATCQG